jgi:hypothetical protein
VYAEMQNPERIIGVFPRVRFSIPYYSFMSPDFSDVRFEYGYVLPSYWRSVSNGQRATVDVELPVSGKGLYTVYMYYGNPNASRYHVEYQDIGFVWYRGICTWCGDSLFKGARVPSASGGTNLLVLWVRADSATYYRVFMGSTCIDSGDVYFALLRGRWGMEYVNASAGDFYGYIYKNYAVTSATQRIPAGGSISIDVNVPAGGWYTIVLKHYMSVCAFVVYEIDDLGTGNRFGNAIDFIPIDGYRARLVPVIWDTYFYSYSIGDAQPVAYVAPATPSVVWNATIGNAYFEYYVAPRTVTVTVPVTVTVGTPIYVTIPPSTTVVTTVYVPVSTVTTWVALPPTTIYRTVTVTVPEYTYRVYTTTVTVPTTITRTVTAPVTTTIPVTTTTVIGGTPTVTTIWVTTTTTTTYYLYTTTTVTSPWIITAVSPYTTVTKTITTTIPVTTTMYAEATVPVYYTTTLTLVNTGANTVTTAVKVNATATYWVNGSYAAVYPVVVGPYGGVSTTTVYWVVKSPYTVTTTVYGGAGFEVSWGWLALVAMVAVLGLAIWYLIRRR